MPHQMILEIAEGKHKWACPTCSRIVLVESDGLKVLVQGDPLATHQGAGIPDSESLGLDFDTDIISPEERAMLDQWRNEFDDHQDYQRR